MAWMSGALPVKEELFLYYGGYARGHKVAPERERQIGLARMPKDRYVCRQAGAKEGWLRTPLIVISAERLMLNLRARGGELRVRLLDPAGRPLPGFDWADHRPLSEDALAAPVRWKSALG